MGSHPVNLAIRFALELAALLATGVWGYRQSDGWFSIVLAIGLPLLLAAVWGIFAVPDDPSRSGGAPVVTPGIVRLIIELSFFGFATWALNDMGAIKISLAFGTIVFLHYLASYDRILWLISRGI